MSTDSFLATARRSLEGGKPTAALEALVAAWRAEPAPELLELACAVSPPVPLQAAKGKETIEALERARKAKRDPRTSRALEQLLLEVPWTADSSKPVWRAAFELVTALKDPRWVGLAETLPAQWKFRAPMVAWMQSQLKKAVSPLSKDAPVLRDAQRAEVQALRALVPGEKAPKAAGSGVDAAALLAAVYASPADDAPRRVFADFLLEQGDVRGEFIALQLAGDAASSAKAEKLAAKHGKQWLDGLTIARAPRFRRGFLASVKVAFKNQREAEKYGALPSWATVEELELDSTNNANDQRSWGQLVPATAVSLKKLRGFNRYGIERLLQEDRALPLLTLLEGYCSEFEQWRALTQTALLPKLEYVELSGVQPTWLEKARAPTRWRHLGMRFGELGSLFRAVSATTFETFTFDHRGWASFAFSRGQKGRLCRLVLRMTEGHAPRVVKSLLDQLPEGCLEAFEVEGPSDDTVVAARQRLVRASVAEVSAPERKLVAPLALFARNDGNVLWADVAGLVELDAKGKVLRSLAPSSWSSAVFSADGARVLGGSFDQVETVDTASGERVDKASVPCSTSYSTLCLSRDGKVLATAMNPGVAVSWPGTTTKPIVYKGASCFALTPDGKTLIRCDLTWGKASLQLHVVGEKTRAVKFAQESPEFTAVACAPDGARFATANAEGALQLWDLATRTCVQTIAGLKDVRVLSFSPDGARLVAGGRKASWVIDLGSGQKTALEGGTDAVAWTRDGRFLRASNARLVGA